MVAAPLGGSGSESVIGLQSRGQAGLLSAGGGGGDGAGGPSLRGTLPWLQSWCWLWAGGLSSSPRGSLHGDAWHRHSMVSPEQVIREQGAGVGEGVMPSVPDSQRSCNPPEHLRSPRPGQCEREDPEVRTPGG